MKSIAKHTRWLLACGVIAPLLFVITFTIDGLTRADYDPAVQWVSHLSLGDRWWLGTLNLAITGILLLLFGAAVKRVLTGKTTWPVRYITGMGIGLLIAAAFTQDPGLGYPTGVEATKGSWHDTLHSVGALMLFVGLTALPIRLRNYFGGGWKTYSLLTAFGVAAAFIATSVLVSMDYAGTLPDAPSGLLERIALIIGFAWVFVLATRLSNTTRGNK